MKIAILNTNDGRWGATVACMNLHKGLLGLGYDSTFFTKSKKSGLNTVEVLRSPLPRHVFNEVKHQVNQRFRLGRSRSSVSNTLFSPEYPGLNANVLDKLRNYDIINLHWVSHYLSVANIGQLLKLRKPIIWTFHDQNPYTGGCHFTAGCENFMLDCDHCVQLEDHTWKFPVALLKLKKELWNSYIIIAAPSKWMITEAKKSPLFRDNDSYVIPSSVDTDIFKPIDRMQARQKLGLPGNAFVILFSGASIHEKRKGYDNFKNAVSMLKLKIEGDMPGRQVQILMTGESKTRAQFDEIPVQYTGYINNDRSMAEIYSSSDLFALPSLEDNYPNVLLESLACGTPAVAFGSGGIPDIIEHNSNGLLVACGDDEAFAGALYYLYKNPDIIKAMSEKARLNILSRNTISTHAVDYYELFSKLTNFSNQLENRDIAIDITS